MQWEYKCDNFPLDRSCEYRINQVGIDGWELVSWQLMQAVMEPTIAHRGAVPHAVPIAACIFKRPKTYVTVDELVEGNGVAHKEKSIT